MDVKCAGTRLVALSVTASTAGWVMTAEPKLKRVAMSRALTAAGARVIIANVFLVSVATTVNLTTVALATPAPTGRRVLARPLATDVAVTRATRVNTAPPISTNANVTTDVAALRYPCVPTTWVRITAAPVDIQVLAVKQTSTNATIHTVVMAWDNVSTPWVATDVTVIRVMTPSGFVRPDVDSQVLQLSLGGRLL